MWDFAKGTPVKIHTPEVVAYHNNEQLYLAPNLKMCKLTKDIHFLCPSKPFVCNNTEGICGLESIRPDTSWPAEATPHSQVEVTQAEIFGNRWLVNTPAQTATLTYDQHDTTTRTFVCPTKLHGSLSLRARSSILTSSHCITLPTTSIRLKSKSHPSSNSIPLSSIQNWKKGSRRKERNLLI